jgi:hypothetical protein
MGLTASKSKSKTRSARSESKSAREHLQISIGVEMRVQLVDAGEGPARRTHRRCPGRLRGGEHRNVNIGSGANTPGRAGRPIEHPGRNLQPSPGCPTREAATENLSASLLNHLMNMDQTSGPRMPQIKKLVLRDPVGVPSSCCTTTSEHIGHWIKMRRSLARFSALESSVRTRNSADFIITTPGSRFSVHTGGGF